MHFLMLLMLCGMSSCLSLAAVVGAAHALLCSRLPLTNLLRSVTLEEIEYPGTIPHEFCGLSR